MKKPLRASFKGLGFGLWRWPTLVILRRLQLTVAVSASPTAGQSPLDVRFNADVSGVPPYIFQWDFGDGGTSSVQNPTYTYSNPGTYKATCTVTDRLMRTASDSVTITVTAPPPPPQPAPAPTPAPAPAPAEPTPTPAPEPLTLSISATPTGGQAPLTVGFEAQASGGTGSKSYAWEFGDGGKSGYQNPGYTYNDPGTYAATCRVTDGAGAVASSQITITVTAPPPPPEQPPLGVEISGPYPANPKVGDAVSFESRVSDGAAPYDYFWDFGDGQTAIYQNPVWYPTVAGVFTVTLTVTDASGRTGSDQVVVTVT